eukprot:TRINITY_DN3577_c0_g1_i2.p1 TRINITY_DN3577_c0_g1~~TRINITY_DN3577_c0_g1_i2.p1  ORF type:complete len:831 (+),score=274.27 TRINITY_DN3577_c0_g1_i2:70-2493(+)
MAAADAIALVVSSCRSASVPATRLRRLHSVYSGKLGHFAACRRPRVHRPPIGATLGRGRVPRRCYCTKREEDGEGEKEKGAAEEGKNAAADKKDGPPPGWEPWFPSADHPDLPLYEAEEKARKDKKRTESKRSEEETQRGGEEEEQTNEDDAQSEARTRTMLYVGGAAFIGYGLLSWWQSRPPGTLLEWPHVVQLVMSGSVGTIAVYDRNVGEIFLKEEDGSISEEASHHMQVGDPEVFEAKLEALQAERDAKLAPGAPSAGNINVLYRVHDHGALQLLWQCSLPLLVIYFFQLHAPRMQRQAASQLFNQGQQSKFKKEVNVATKFRDVAGMAEAKQEILEVVDFLKSPERYHRLGAKIPTGVLLNGPPGTGKTLLARATAGESGVPFYSVAGSDFVEMFVGVGPSRVRELFKEARKSSPCIIFVDEIDAIGRKRQTSGGRGRDSEQESTLNAILVEMDGFKSREGVVVLAGTNRQDILDKALLRPGRFDRQIAIDKPPLADRVEIFMVHLAPLKLGRAQKTRDVATKLATLTPGFSGADIMNVCNEAALTAARRNEDHVTGDCFDLAIEKIIGGLEKPTKKVAPREKRMVAFHEAGHVICAWFLQSVDPVLKVSIVPRGGDRIGYTQHLPKDKYLITQDELKETMVKLMGGRAAEQLVFGEVSTGAADDMNRVTQMAAQQVLKYGFSTEKIGHLSFPEGSANDIVLQKPYSHETERVVDSEVRALVDAAYDRAMALLVDKREVLDKLGELLYDKEFLGIRELTEVLGERPNMTEELRSYVRAAVAADAAGHGDEGGKGAAEEAGAG